MFFTSLQIVTRCSFQGISTYESKLQKRLLLGPSEVIQITMCTGQSLLSPICGSCAPASPAFSTCFAGTEVKGSEEPSHFRTQMI